MNKLRPFVGACLVPVFVLVAQLSVAASVPPAELAAGALHWRSLGPYRGGIVETVAGIANEPSVFYAGMGGGGVWETTNYGHSWENISDKYFKSNNIGAIAVAPSNPKVIYVGTGNPAFRNTFMTGDGMYKSTDGGKSWSHIGLDKTGIISWIIVDPNNANIVYAAAFGRGWASNSERGVFKSTDGGMTWKRVLYVNDETGAITLAMDPANPQVLYASMWQAYRRHWFLSSGGPGSGLYKTTDGGATWTNISHNTGLPPGIWGKVTVAVAPSDPSVVYSVIQVKYRGQIGGLFRSDDAGKSWTLVNNSPSITQRAMYYMRVFVDPKDPNLIYLPNTSIQVSHDGGRTLTRMQPPHGDNHAFWINPNDPNLFVEGNDGGATVTRDGGKTWSSELNQPTGQFYHASLDNQFPFHIYAAQQDDGSYTGPSAVARGSLPATWTSIQGGEFGWPVSKPDQPWITFANGYYSDEWRENSRTGLITQVSPWPGFKFGLAGTQEKYRWGWWHRPAVFAPHNPNELLLGANVVFETLNDGHTWKAISPDLTRNDKSKEARSGGPISADMTGEEMFEALSSLAFSPLSDNTIWAGSDDGLVYVTTDNGAHWDPVRPPNLPTWSTITCIEPSHMAAGTAYLTASRFEWDDYHPYVYKTTDYGKHWTEITAGLPDNQYVESIRQDPDDSNLLLVGTGTTVFMSLDGGSHWLPLALNLPPVRITDVEIQPEQHAVVLSTFGRAFWSLDNLQFLEQLSNAQVASDAPYLFKPQQTWLVKRSSFSFGGAGVGGANLPVGATVFFHLPADYQGGPVKLTFSNTNGKVIDSFTFPTRPVEIRGMRTEEARRLHPGMNMFLWDMHYPRGVLVKGVYYAGRGANVPIGPEVVPGTYDVKLSYNGHTQTQPFTVELDPRLTTTQAELQQRFDLLMKIYDATNQLATTISKAVDLRSRLEAGGANKTAAALADLNNEIDGVVDFRIQSSRGFDVFPPRLLAWLSAIYSRVDTAYVAPSPALTQVADEYLNDERQGVARLQSAITRANAALGQ